MNRGLTLTLASVLLVLADLGSAQQTPLPKELSGRYLHAESGRSQTFSLDEIAERPDKTFSAKLTWWSITDSRCSVRGEPIVGRVTDSGIAFDAKNKCDLGFTVQLDRGKNEWTGSAKTTTGPEATFSIKAS
jgi:hypothetical protein